MIHVGLAVGAVECRGTAVGRTGGLAVSGIAKGVRGSAARESVGCCRATRGGPRPRDDAPHLGNGPAAGSGRGRKKGGAGRECADCKTSRAHCGRKVRQVMTAAGLVRVRRIYFRCSRCASGGYALDERLGMDGRYSPDARRLICLAGGSWSYDLAAERLGEMCGVVVSDTTVRELSQAEGAQMAVWQRTAPEVRTQFETAKGDVEFATDGTMVNTTEGWQEVRLGVLPNRPRGPAARPEEGDDRELPPPQARVGFAAIEASDRFGTRWDQWAARLGVKDRSTITVLADGAKWIWEEARQNLIGSAGVLDIYHALEHVSDAAKILFGEGSTAAREWTDTAPQPP